MPSVTPPETQITTTAIISQSYNPSTAQSAVPLPQSQSSSDNYSGMRSWAVARVKKRSRLPTVPSGCLAGPIYDETYGYPIEHSTLKKVPIRKLMTLIEESTQAITSDARAWMYEGVFRLSGSESKKNECIKELVRSKEPKLFMENFIADNYSNAVPVLKKLLLAFRDKATAPPPLTNLAELKTAEEKRCKKVAEILSEESPSTFDALVTLANTIIENSHTTKGDQALTNACRIMHEVLELDAELKLERKRNQQHLRRDSSWTMENFMGQGWRRRMVIEKS